MLVRNSNPAPKFGAGVQTFKPVSTVKVLPVATFKPAPIAPPPAVPKPATASVTFPKPIEKIKPILKPVPGPNQTPKFIDPIKPPGALPVRKIDNKAPVVAPSPLGTITPPKPGTGIVASPKPAVPTEKYQTTPDTGGISTWLMVALAVGGFYLIRKAF